MKALLTLLVVVAEIFIVLEHVEVPLVEQAAKVCADVVHGDIKCTQGVHCLHVSCRDIVNRSIHPKNSLYFCCGHWQVGVEPSAALIRSGGFSRHSGIGGAVIEKSKQLEQY